MILFEIFITILVIAAAVLAGVAWVTRPIWTALWKRHRQEELEERRAVEIEEQVRLRREEEARRSQEAASAEFEGWLEEAKPRGETEEQECREDGSQ